MGTGSDWAAAGGRHLLGWGLRMGKSHKVAAGTPAPGAQQPEQLPSPPWGPTRGDACTAPLADPSQAPHFSIRPLPGFLLPPPPPFRGPIRAGSVYPAGPGSGSIARQTGVAVNHVQPGNYSHVRGHGRSTGARPGRWAWLLRSPLALPWAWGPQVRSLVVHASPQTQANLLRATEPHPWKPESPEPLVLWRDTGWEGGTRGRGTLGSWKARVR